MHCQPAVCACNETLKEVSGTWRWKSPVYCSLGSIYCESQNLPMSPESKQRIQGWTWKGKETICLGRGVIKTKLCALPKCKFRIIFPSDNSLFFSLIFFLVGCRQTAPAQAILLLGWLLLASVAWSNADQRQRNAPCGLQRVWEQKAQVLQQCLYSASLFRGEMLKATFHPKSLKVFRLSCAQTREVFFPFLLRACGPCS